MLKNLLFILLVFCSGQLVAQDIHFTQFQMAPMNFNPSQTGQFHGTVRVGGIYRDQWSIYRTPSFYIDAPLFNIRGRDWIGVGITAIRDEAGSAKLNNTGAKLALAYHLAFDKKRKTVLSIGGQYGLMGRSLNREALKLEDDSDIVNIAADAQYRVIDAGINLSSKLSKTSDLTIGVGLNHLNRPENGLVDKGFNLPTRLIAHGQLNMALNNKWGLSPAFLFQQISSASEFELQGVSTYYFNPDWKFRGGLGYRFGDSAQVILGALYKNLNVGFSYDIGASGTNSALKNIGAFEIAANYIFKIMKKPTVKPAVFCPRF